MLKSLQNKTVGTRVILGVVVGMLGIGMLVYLVPQGGSNITASDTVADVGGNPVTVAEVQRQLQRMSRANQIPKSLEPFYAQQIVNGLVFERMLEVEAKRLGIRVTQQEQFDRIRQLVPASFTGDSVVGMEQYQADVQMRFGMGYQEFEELVRQALLEEKFRRLVTDGVSVTPDEIQQEFQRRNEKIKFEYVLIAPDALEARISPSDAELEAYFAKNKPRYVVPERRAVRYAVLNLIDLRKQISIPEPEMRAYYNAHIDQFKVESRVHVQHILFKTSGKTDAEIQEIQKKADEVLKQLKSGAKFEDLAKKYSEDSAKDKGGDIGWIAQHQALPEYEQAAFSLPKGSVSGQVKTQIGIYIIKVIDKETARTKPFEEVRDLIVPIFAGQKAEEQAATLADKIAAEIRKNNRVPLDQLAKQFSLTVTETAPITSTDTVPELGNSPDIRDAIFRMRPGDVNLPIRTDRSYLILTVKEILPSHAATLAEVREKVLADYRHETAVGLAKSRADELFKRAQAGEALSAAAKPLGLEAKTSDPIARNDSVTGLGSGKQLAALFSLPAGKVAPPIQLAANWVLAKLLERTEPKSADFDGQKTAIEQQLLQSKRQVAYEAFRSALEDRLKAEGLLKFNPDTLKRLTSPA